MLQHVLCIVIWICYTWSTENTVGFSWGCRGLTQQTAEHHAAVCSLPPAHSGVGEKTEKMQDRVC